MVRKKEGSKRESKWTPKLDPKTRARMIPLPPSSSLGCLHAPPDMVSRRHNVRFQRSETCQASHSACLVLFAGHKEGCFWWRGAEGLAEVTTGPLLDRAVMQSGATPCKSSAFAGASSRPAAGAKTSITPPRVPSPKHKTESLGVKLHLMPGCDLQS